MRRYPQENAGSGRLISAVMLLFGIGGVLLILMQNRDVPPEKMSVPTVRPTLLAELPSETPTITVSPSASPTGTATQTPTLTLSPTLITPSATLPPTETGEPTETPFLTFTPLPTPPCQTIVINGRGAYVRSGPGTDYDPIESVPQNAIFEVVGFLRSDDGLVWHNVKLPDGTPGWISSGVSEILRENVCGEIAQAPTVPPTPLPITQTPDSNSRSIYPTSNATPFCGDNVCQPGENSAVCSVDCPFSGGSIPNDRTPFPYEQTSPANPVYTPQYSGNPIDSPGSNPTSTPYNRINPGNNGGDGIPFSCDIAEGVSYQECVALSSLYLGTNGQNWTNHSNWMTNRNVCSWYGVSCNSCALNGGNCAGSSVYVLYLANNNLQGQIPPNLGNLPNLLILHMENNNLSGSVPQELTNLSQLRTICLFGNPNLDSTLPPPLDTIGCR